MTFKNGRPAVAPLQHGGWGYQILPYIEQEAVWMGSGATTDIDRSIVAISTPISGFFCPSRRKPETVEAQDWYSNPNSGKKFKHAKNDYASASWDTSAQQPYGVGAIQQMEPAGIQDVKDGTTNTLLIGEKRMNIAFLGQMQANDNEGYTCGWNHDTNRYTEREPRPDFRDNGGDPGDDRFGSSHANGVNFALCDGSVRFIGFTVDQQTFSRLGNKRDGQVVQLP
jgi:prepilin-type processing-associated H-X9-DG protein